MSQISYENFEQSRQTSANQGEGKRIGFFSLKDHGNEAIVRIMHDSPADFDIVTTHPVVIDGKHKRVNCLRDPREPLENCPYCAADQQTQQRLYIHLLEYVKQEDGSVKAFARMWERSSAYVQTLKNLMDEYGPLSDNVFKIKRNGEHGSVDTTYDIMYANPTIYRPEIYIKDTKAFEGVKAVGTCVLNKSFEELTNMLNPQTTQAPVTQQSTVQPTSVAEPTPVRHYEPTPVASYENDVSSQSSYTQPQQSAYTNNSVNNTFTQDTVDMYNRPKRLY